MLNYDDIKAARNKAAQLVANFGDEFLPAFLRAEALLKAAERNQTASERARQIASNLQ
ncbi:hypothetical protein [Tritonibacter mobilis]|uniref:hypothetical protein n=1 Tax=Tritonibacter mobilis TaxID=379347 RepID=UPI003A5C120A